MDGSLTERLVSILTDRLPIDFSDRRWKYLLNLKSYLHALQPPNSSYIVLKLDEIVENNSISKNFQRLLYHVMTKIGDLKNRTATDDNDLESIIGGMGVISIVTYHVLHYHNEEKVRK
jgi:hypothetical protein